MYYWYCDSCEDQVSLCIFLRYLSCPHITRSVNSMSQLRQAGRLPFSHRRIFARAVHKRSSRRNLSYLAQPLRHCAAYASLDMPGK